MPTGKFLAGVILLLGVSLAEARPRGPIGITGVAQNNGDTRTVFSVALTTHTWTLVRNSLSKRRRLDLQLSNFDTSSGVCLSSTSVASNACLGGTGGYELIVSTPVFLLSLQDEATWYGRIRGGNGNAAVLKGVEYSDSGD